MASTLAITGLAATPGPGQVYLTLSLPRDPCLPYLALAHCEVWEATVNDRAQAVQVAARVKGASHLRNGLEDELERFYWARPVDDSGQIGDWYPASPTGGVSAKPKAGNAVTIALSSEAHVLPADAAGSVLNYLGATSNVTVREGAADVTSAWQLSISASSGVTAQLAAGTITVTAMSAATSVGYVDVTATRSGFILSKRFSVSKAQNGAAGTSGSNGQRGAGRAYASGHVAWNSASAGAAIVAVYGNGPIVSDEVTLYGPGYAETRRWTGSAWVAAGQVVDGNLLVTGTLSVAALIAGTFTGFTFQTKDGTPGQYERVVISSADNTVRLYDSQNQALVIISASNNSGSIFAYTANAYKSAITGAAVGAAQSGIAGTHGGNGYGVYGRADGAGGWAIFADGRAYVKTDLTIGGTAYGNFSGWGNFTSGNFTGTHGGAWSGAFAATTVSASQGGSYFGSGSGNGAVGHGSGSKGVLGSDTGNALRCDAGGVWLKGNSITAFTGAHEILVPRHEALEIGDIIVDAAVVRLAGVNDALTAGTRSTMPRQRSVAGVFSECRPLTAGHAPSALVLDDGAMAPEFATHKDTHDVAVVNGLGEGAINVTGENGNLTAGDLLVTSSTPGKAMRQVVPGSGPAGPSDDLIRSCTVAKVRCDVVFAQPGEVRLVPCIYLCA